MEYEELTPRFKASLLDWMKTKNPFWTLLGMELVDAKKGWARVKLPYTEKLNNAIGIVHGGAIFSPADSAIGIALAGLIDKNESISTLEMKINFIKSFKGGELFAEAKIIHRGTQTAIGEVDVLNDQHNLIAKGLATYAIFKREQP
jgi:uncharacterized protein (TIGR00369 family)